MNANCIQVKLGEICDLTIGRTPSRSNIKLWDPEKVTENLWLSISDLPQIPLSYIDHTREHISDEGASFTLVKAGTLVMSFKLSIGRVAIAGKDLRTNEAIAAFNNLDVKRVDPLYLGYLLHSFDWKKITMGNEKLMGATLNKKILSELEICLPSLSEQKQILSKLLPSLELINDLKKSSKESTRLQDQLWRSTLSRTFENLNDSEIVELVDVAQVVSGQSPNGKSYNSDGIGTEFHQGKKFFGKYLLAESGIWTTEPTKLTLSGDVLISVRAPVGPVNLVDREVCIGRGLAAIRCGSRITPEYIYWYLKSIQSELIGSEGAVFPSIDRQSIEQVRIRLPSVESQKNIIKTIEETHEILYRFGRTKQEQIELMRLFEERLLNTLIKTEAS